jgi:hypothetical protein
VSDPEIRVGDAEREEALRALGDHMSAGRLDIDEYGERTARVAASKTRGDLLALFKDLPEPRPTFQPPVHTRAATSAPSPAAPPPQAPAGPRAISVRLYAALVPVSWVFTVLLYFTVARTPFVFILPLLVMLLGASIWGDDWTRERRAQRDRGRRHRDDSKYWRDYHKRYRDRH